MRQDHSQDSATRARRRPWYRWPLLAVSLLALGGIGGGLFALDRSLLQDAALSRPAQADGAARVPGTPVSVIVQPVIFANAAPRRFVAVLKPRLEAPLAFQVAGRVEARLVETGARVIAGQELARLVQSDFQLAADQAAAELRAAEEARASAVEEEDRVAALHRSGVVAKAALDAARSAAEEARARVDRARAQVDLTGNAAGYATLRAAADGVILSQSLESGQIVAPGEPVLRIAYAGALEAEVALPETLAGAEPGLAAEFLPWSAPGEGIAASLREISPIADSATHTFLARFTLASESAGLSPGMTGHLRIEPPEGQTPLVRLPAAALYDPGSGNGEGLWRVTPENILEFVPAETVAMDGSDLLVRAALDENDRVVALGANRLQAGQSVAPVERAAE